MTDSTAALALLVKRLRAQVDGLQETVGRHEAQLDGLASLAQLIQDHVNEEDDQATRPSAPVWDGLSREQYDAQLAQLTEFVDQHLRVAYRDYLGGVLHDCWPRHLAALWELGNLCAEWTRIYHRGQPSLSGALAWHDRWLPGVKTRLADIMHGCREGRCSKDSGPVADMWRVAR